MKKIIAFALAALMLFALAACNNVPATEPTTTEPAAQTDMEYVKAKGTLVVGITDFAPMDYAGDSGEWIGFDADMAKLFAQKLGVDVEFIEIVWDNKVMELNGKTIDCVWNGMTLVDEVVTAMECSEPYCNNSQVVVVPAAQAADYQTVDACKALNFAVESGSAGMKMAIENGFNYTEVEDQATAVMEAASGTCDGAIIDSLMANAMVGEGTGYAQLAYTVKLNDEKYGVGFRKGSDLAAALNGFFAECRQNGKLAEVAATYKVDAAVIL